MRIIELLIDKLEELNGFDAVALVEEPAIEADFFAFNNKEVLNMAKRNPIDLQKNPCAMFLRFKYISLMCEFSLPML